MRNEEGRGGSALVTSSPVIASDYQTAPRGARRKACLAPLTTARKGQVLPDEEMPRTSARGTACGPAATLWSGDKARETMIA